MRGIVKVKQAPKVHKVRWDQPVHKDQPEQMEQHATALAAHLHADEVDAVVLIPV